MKRQSQGRGVQFWAVLAVLTVGVLLVAGMGAVASAGTTQIASGQLRPPFLGSAHCAVVNLGTLPITVRVALINGDNGSTCDDAVQTIDPFESRGVNCPTDDGVYCLVTGTFDKNKVRGTIRTRDDDGNEHEALDLR